MLITLIAKVVFLQIIVISIIIFVLIKILDYQLRESAVHQFEVMFAKELDFNLKEIVVVVCKTLSPRIKTRIQTAVSKKLGREIPLIIKQNKNIKGGLIIQLNELILDYSLIGRLRDGGFVRD